jgi:polyferredoxin
MQSERKNIRLLRYAVQLAFLALTLFIGYRFFQFIQHFVSPGNPFVERPASVDAFLPIGGFMDFKYFILTGIVEPVHPSGFIMFAAILGVSLVMKKGFCGWVCPVGTASQYIWMAGEKVFGRNFRIPGFTDISLRSLKYVLMGLFVVAIGVMPMWSMAMFYISDYYKLADVRMMKFFTDMTQVTFWVLAVLAGLSVLYKNFWCRYLCPYGALLGLASRFSPFKVQRNEQKCTHCHACTKHCPTHIDVEKSEVVRSAECFGCLTCVSRCPSEGALELTLRAGPKVRTVNPYVFPVVLIILFYLIIGLGMVTDNWKSKIPYEEYQRLVPQVEKEYSQR